MKKFRSVPQELMSLDSNSSAIIVESKSHINHLSSINMQQSISWVKQLIKYIFTKPYIHTKHKVEPMHVDLARLSCY